MQSLELLLDPATDDVVRGIWARLADEGMPSQADHTGASNAPHVTLVAARGMSVPVGIPGLPIPVTLGPPVVMGAGEVRTLALGVVASAELLAFHATAWESARPADPTPYSAPGSWTPHVTLARRIPLASLPDALDVVGESSAIEASAIVLRHWDPATGVVTPLPRI